MPIEAEIVRGNAFDLRELLQAILEKWWLVANVTLAFGLLGGFYIWRHTITYQARAVLQVEQEQKNLLSAQEVSQEDLRAAEVINTIAQNIKNTSVLLRVVRSNELTSDPSFLPRYTNHFSEINLAGALAGMVTVKLRPETRLIDITVAHPDAVMAQKLANSVAEESIRQNMDQRFSTTKAGKELLYAEAGKLKEKLEDSEKKLQDYKEQNQTISLEDRQNIVVEKLKALNAKYSAAQADRLQAEADLKQILKLTNQPDALLSLPMLLQDQSVSELRRKIVELAAQVATLSLRYKPAHPKMIQARQELNDLTAALHALAMRAPRWTQAAFDGAWAREKNFEAGLQAVQLESLDLDRRSIQFNVLLREVQSDRALYDSVLKRLKETDLSKGLEKTSISLVEPAGRPGLPVRPSNALIITAAAVVGVIFGVGLVCLLKMVDGSIRTVDQAEVLLNLPVLAAIPIAKTSLNGTPPHILIDDPGSICSEGFRTLRTTTGLMLREGEKKIVLFTSADPHEGKTFFSLNHAICQAQEGRRTLLIDLDLRRPAIGESFSLPAETPGVTDYLSGKGSLASLVQATQYPNLFVLPAGRKHGRPAELLGHDAIRKLLAEADQEYQSIVLDTPPINAVSDAFLVLHLAHVICLVVRTGRTPRRAILRAVELMARADVSPSGIVLNFLPERSGYGYYYHYAPKAGYYREGVYSRTYDTDVTLSS